MRQFIIKAVKAVCLFAVVFMTLLSKSYTSWFKRRVLPGRWGRSPLPHFPHSLAALPNREPAPADGHERSRGQNQETHEWVAAFLISVSHSFCLVLMDWRETLWLQVRNETAFLTHPLLTEHEDDKCLTQFAWGQSSNEFSLAMPHLKTSTYPRSNKSKLHWAANNDSDADTWNQ